MSYNREEASFPATPSPPSSNALYEDYGLTHQQWCNYEYPEEPLDVINAQLATVTRELGSTGASPSPSPAANDDDIDNSMDLDNPRLVASQLQARDSVTSRGRVSTVAKRPAEGTALIGTDFVAKSDPVRAAIMANLTKEARTATLPPGVPHRKQLDLLRDMPLRRQLSLRISYEDFYRTCPDYWDATAGYLVGEVVPEPCIYYKAGNGLFVECVVVPPQLGSDRQPLGRVCMSCAYQSSGGKCSFHPNHNQWKERTDRERKEREGNAILSSRYRYHEINSLVAVANFVIYDLSVLWHRPDSLDPALAGRAWAGASAGADADADPVTGSKYLLEALILV
ncbi:hypothetical protein BCON_0026g00110 [Botryotinia convoluta]|uniref:Uncharacterized protein n=1 Tax=Botryotinia convoluta TaxID=54673 RepID=A0A4Z1IYB1_9HELO|nr:hypothetical protein BCON_0026g00110 [Botryotinia convoluta]